MSEVIHSRRESISLNTDGLSRMFLSIIFAPTYNYYTIIMPIQLDYVSILVWDIK